MVSEIVAAAARAAGDEEPDDRKRIAKETAEKHARGERVTDGPKLASELADGDAFVRRLSAWFGGVSEGIDASEQDLGKVTAQAWAALEEKNDPPTIFR